MDGQLSESVSQREGNGGDSGRRASRLSRSAPFITRRHPYLSSNTPGRTGKAERNGERGGGDGRSASEEPEVRGARGPAAALEAAPGAGARDAVMLPDCRLAPG